MNLKDRTLSLNCFHMPQKETTAIERIGVSGTDDPFYSDSRYNDKIHYNDSLTVKKPTLKR